MPKLLRENPRMERKRPHRRWLLALGAALGAGLAALVVIPVGGAPTAQALTNCSADPAIDSEEQAFLGIINDYRQDNGLNQLVISQDLSRAAAWKGKHLGDYGYFAHDDEPINRTWVQRIRDCGYGYNTWLGENLAAGNQGASASFNQWRSSAGHNANMLGENYAAIGIARVYVAGSDFSWYWVTEFGGALDVQIVGGDVDCNGRIDPIDATLILQRAAGMVTSLPCGSRADADGSGSVDATDALVVLQHYAGLI
jgi:uncharacterized protein YkwD